MTSRRGLLLLTPALCLGGPLAAQRTDSAVVLPELVVVRTAMDPTTAGLALTVLGREALRRSRNLPGLDEALAFVPGVVARDRGDHSLDQRLAIRGAGARANFGVRGIRVLVDGVPATLPDGQTPLTVLALDLAERIEVVRGPLAALHGNGTEGVVAITTAARPDGPWQVRAGTDGGGESTLRNWLVLGGGGRRLGGSLSANRLATDGSRAHATARQWRLHGAVDWQVAPDATVTLRADHADDPHLESPGALTLAEWRDDPTSASPTSVLRNAGKSLRQSQLALGWRRDAGPIRSELHAWVLGRSLENPIAAPAPAPARASEGIWIGIERAVEGLRGSLSTRVGRVLFTGGVDLQHQRDDRVNRRHDAGIPSGDPFLDQQERTSEAGMFGQFSVPIGSALGLRAGVRRDRVAFAVTDHLDAAAGGSRVLAAWSGDAVLSHAAGGHTVWLGVATAFETPTTTELANRPDGSTGLNHDLDPARTLSVEIGARLVRGTVQAEATAFRAETRDAILPIAEEGGRSYFANVGTTHRAGVELGGAWTPTPGLGLRATGTWIDASFGKGARDANGSSIAGNPLPGVARMTARLGAAFQRGALALDIDQEWSSSVSADDDHTIVVPGWGPGVINLAARWQVSSGVSTSLAVQNLFDRRFVAGVVANGGFGRVVEPGGGRRLIAGLSIDLGR